MNFLAYQTGHDNIRHCLSQHFLLTAPNFSAQFEKKWRLLNEKLSQKKYHIAAINLSK